MKKICIEEHWGHVINEEIREDLQQRTKFPRYADPEFLAMVFPKMGAEAFEEHRLPDMDKNDISMQVISFASPGIQGILDPNEAVAKAKKVNDMQAELINRYPNRFAGFAALPLQDPKAAADELERTVNQLGFKGALINGHTNGEYLDERKFWVVWERAEALGVPIYLHPYDPLADQIKIYKGYNELLGATWSWGVETGTHALRIICSGVFDAFPKATLILGHMGEMIPYVLGRIDEGYRISGGKKTWKIKKMPSQYVKENVMVTTSGLWYPETLLCAIRALGIDRIMFATDYPFVSTKEAVALIENSPISHEFKEKIYCLNAKRFLGL